MKACWEIHFLQSDLAVPGPPSPCPKPRALSLFDPHAISPAAYAASGWARRNLRWGFGFRILGFRLVRQSL